MAKNDGKSLQQTPQESQSTALEQFAPADVLADLLRAQQESVSGDLELPRIKIVGAGVGMYEFPDEGETVKEFEGVILGAHGRNVLWTKKMEPGVQRDDDEARPACSSADGKFGRPQEGFKHIMLNGEAATGNELISCADCKYNKFGSGNIFIPDKNKKGKAVTNQKTVYVYLPDRLLPFQLTLNTMSIPGYDEYVTKLLRRGIPTQAVTTVFRQVVKQSGSVKYAIATFVEGKPLAKDAFDDVMTMYKNYRDRIEPAPAAKKVEAKVAKDDVTLEETDDVPFTVEDVSTIPATSGDDKAPF